MGDLSGTEQSLDWINCPHCSSTLYDSKLSEWGGLGFILYGKQNLRRNFFCIECYEFIPFAMVFSEENEYRGRSKSKSKREKWSTGTNHKEWIRDDNHEKERYRIWEIFDGDEIKFAGKVKKMEPHSNEWKIYLRTIGIEPDKLGTNLNLVDEDAQELIAQINEENEGIINKMKEVHDALKKSNESADEFLRELELNKSADLTKNMNYSIESRIEHKQLFSETIQGWGTVFGKARQVADSKPLNVNKREMALLRFVKNKGRYEGKDWMELNRSWRGEMKEVTQARISQIISSLIEKEYLETVQTKGSGSSRVVKIPNNLNIDSLIDSPSNNQRINANSHWSKNDDEKLLALRRDRTLSVAEIAYEMGRSEASIHSRYSIVREKMFRERMLYEKCKIIGIRHSDRELFKSIASHFEIIHAVLWPTKDHVTTILHQMYCDLMREFDPPPVHSVMIDRLEEELSGRTGIPPMVIFDNPNIPGDEFNMVLTQLFPILKKLRISVIIVLGRGQKSNFSSEVFSEIYYVRARTMFDGKFKKSFTHQLA